MVQDEFCYLLQLLLCPNQCAQKGDTDAVPEFEYKVYCDEKCVLIFRSDVTIAKFLI